MFSSLQTEPHVNKYETIHKAVTSGNICVVWMGVSVLGLPTKDLSAQI